MDVLDEIPAFYDRQVARCAGLGIEVRRFPVSHVALRTRTWREYVDLRDRLEERCTGNLENVWNGRPISKLLLREPVPVGAGLAADLMELIPPFHQRVYRMGLEHVGLVVGAHVDTWAAGHRAVLTGQQFQSPICEPYYLLFPDDYTHVKFYRWGLAEVCTREGGSFDGFTHAIGWRPADELAVPTRSAEPPVIPIDLSCQTCVSAVAAAEGQHPGRPVVGDGSGGARDPVRHPTQSAPHPGDAGPRPLTGRWSGEQGGRVNGPERDDRPTVGGTMKVTEVLDGVKDAITVRRVYGEPLEKHGMTIVPAAVVMGGGGGGTGKDEKGQEGEGGGFGTHGRPAGAWVIADGHVTWRPAVDPNRIMTMLGLVLMAWLITRPRMMRAKAAAAKSLRAGR